jgi:predicted LPLAT superfamily acyltransferase
MGAKWTGKSRGKKFFQNLMIVFIKIGLSSLAYFIVYFVALFYCFLPSVIKGSSHYINRRFLCTGPLSRFWRLYKLNLTFGKILIDRAVFGAAGKCKVLSDAKDVALCNDLCKKHNGLIILSAHCGCWQSAMSALDFVNKDEKKYVLYHRSKEDIDKHVHELSGKEAPVKFIDPNTADGGVFEIMAALQKGGVVCMMADRILDGSKNFIKVDFLGGKISLPFSMYKIAHALNKPIAVIFFPYEKRNCIHTIIADTFFVEDGGHKNYIEYAQRFADALEGFTDKYPYQFYNYFNLWEDK